MSVDKYRGSRLDRVVTRLTGGRLGIETHIVYHGTFFVAEDTGERLYPRVGNRARRVLIRTRP